MQSQNEEPGSGKVKKRRRLKWFLIIVVLLLAGLFLLWAVVPFYISSKSGEKMIASKINGAIDGEFGFSDLKMGWFSGIDVSDIRYSDENTDVKVSSVSTRPSYVSLIGGKISLDSTVIREPEVVYNLSEGVVPVVPVGGVGEKTEGKDKAGIALSRLDLEVSGGNVTINMGDRGGIGQKVEFKNIESKIDLNGAGKKSVFALNMGVAQGGTSSTVDVQGDVTSDSKKSWKIKSGQFDVNIKNLKLSSVRPLLAMMGREVDMKGVVNADMTATIDGGVVKRVNGEARLEDFSQVIGDVSARLDKPLVLKADINTERDVVRIDSLSVDSSFMQFDAKGTAEQVSYEASADLGKTMKFASQFLGANDTELSGKFSSKGNMSFSKEIIAAEGSANFASVVATKGKKKTPVTSGDVDFDVSIDSSKKLIEIARLKAESERIGRFGITDGSVAMAGASVSSEVEADARIDLGEVTEFLHVFDIVQNDTSIDGSLVSKANLIKNGSVLGIKTTDSSISNLKIIQGEGEPFLQEKVTLESDVKLNLETKEIDIREFSLVGTQGQSVIKINKGNISRKTDGENTNVQGSFDAEYDLAALTAMAGAFLPGGLSMSGMRRTTINFESTFPSGTEQSGAFLANLSGGADLGFDSAEMMGLKFSAVETKVSFDKGKMDIKPFETTVNEGKLRFGGSADFAKEPSFLRLSEPMQIIENVKLTDEMTRELLVYLNPIFSKQVGVTGNVDFSCDQMALPLRGGSKNDMVLAGNVAMQNVRLQPRGLLSFLNNPGKVTVNPTDFMLRDGVLSYDDMQVDIGDNPLNFGGKIWLDKRMDMKMVLPWTLAGDTVNVGQSSSSRRITVPLEGTVDDPKFDMASVIQSQAGALLEEQLKKVLGGKDKGSDAGKSQQGEAEDNGQVDSEEILRERIRQGLKDIFK